MASIIKVDTIKDTSDNTLLTSSSGNVSISNDLVVDTDTLYVDTTNNRVGIGTTSPSTAFVATTNANGRVIMLTHDTGLNEIRSTDSDQTTYVNLRYDASEHIFEISDTEAMRIDSSGNVGIGTTSPDNSLHILYTDSTAYSNSTGNIGVQIENTDSTTNSFSQLHFRTSNSDSYIRSIRDGDNLSSLVFLTDNGGATGDVGEAMRIDSGGTVLINTTTVPSSTGDDGIALADVGGRIIFARSAGAAGTIMEGYGNLGEMRVKGDGDLENTNNNYTGLSDIRLKENIVDANSQWEDIKALPIKNYNLIKYPDRRLLGVIAQDIENLGMSSLVNNSDDELYQEGDEIPEGKQIGDVKKIGYKAVKYSILYMKAVKALQEAMERIETLEAKVQTLQNAQE